ncbi:hypothetical protein [Pseudaestuariivita sp.]
MRHIENGTRALHLIARLNADRLLVTGTLVAALTGAFWLSGG